MNSKFFAKLNKSLIKVPLDEKIMFTKHMSMMVKSGMSEIESIRLVRRQLKSRGFGLILDDVIAGLENGQFLSDTLKPYERVFGRLFISIISLGEISGTLSENLGFLSSELKESRALHSKVKSAMIYPSIILVATVSVIVALVLFILPRILPIFTSLGAELPLATRILIATTTFLQNYFLLVGLGFIVVVVALILLLKIGAVRYAFHRVFLLIPIAGSISQKYNMANFTRTLGILLRSGVKIVEAVTTAADITENLVFKREILAAAEEIKKGEAMYKHLEEKPKLFPPTVTRMIEVGEKTGNLDDNLDYLASFYEGEVDETVANLSSVLEPALLLIMGGLVGFVAIAIITPIYEITQAF